MIKYIELPKNGRKIPIFPPYDIRVDVEENNTVRFWVNGLDTPYVFEGTRQELLKEYNK